VAALAHEGVSRAVAIALVPQYSAASVGRYFAALEEALTAAGRPFPVAVVRSWATHPLLVEAFAEKVQVARAGFTGGEPRVVFSAHSVPVQALPMGDPYEAELRATAAAVAGQSGIGEWDLAFQSAGRAGGAWYGPSLAQTIDTLAGEGAKQVLVVPIHFLVANLEVLYDLDVEMQERARRLGLHLARTDCLNDSPLLVAALADLVGKAAGNG
ncbi:MAG: ferrochelatase, partial [Chloroflexota bacterium]